MIIRIIASSQSLELDDASNFKGFTVRIEGAFGDPAVLAGLLARVAPNSDGEHAWISEKVLREWPKLAAESWWQEGLSKMIAAVQPFGWIDAASQTIRVHIDYAP
jgi:hypothetical protein